MRFLLILMSLFLVSCTTTDKQRIFDIATSEQPDKAIKAIVKDKQVRYQQNPEQIVKDVQAIGDLFTQLKKGIRVVWGEKQIQLPTNKRYVKYTNDYKARAIVDFEKGWVRVETIDTKSPTQMLQKAIVTTLLATSDPDKTDIFSSETPKASGKPFLYQQVLDQDKQAIAYPWRANRFADYLITHHIKKRAIDYRFAHYVDISLVEQHQHLRQEKFSEFVLSSAKRYQIAPALIYGVIETESSFNPFAVSHANAYGLMQVVSSTAGRDVYQKVKNKAGQPSKQVLFDPKQNIDIGTAYLYILKNQYLSKISNLTSRHYAVISAYNGGAGNVLKTFSNDRKVAIERINTLAANEVYDKLTQQHPRVESRRYLYKVRKAEKKYQ
ncbi:membrane-bound lytic murein transglycosylase MltC [Catenovulum sp. SM1970]|uniref:membrane-bound lytic murein transglycosylase MltC n=1 Tax=Marinifaba aquimaris TaxID=2741323 RepID=UPI001572DBDF|nr:membrane-bound lytic murein transglycosylase MltC [Marinifaba aquimaris]NTS75548.1 membrane-bound lytic murein transglycosylase MltC [Marinifaba aquimaris]